MKPTPETAALIEEFGDYFDAGLLDQLQRQADAVTELVPDLVGLSLAWPGEGVAVTLVATDLDVAVLDAIQHVEGEPRVDPARAERDVLYDSEDPDDEGDWQAFAKTTAAKAVATTLTLPILDGENVTGMVDLYAASSGAFRGLHEDIAQIFDAWAPGAVTNADLSFQTRQAAAGALERLRARARVEAAVGLLMAVKSIDEEAARTLLGQAAQRVGVSLEQAAGTMLEAFEPPEQN